MEGGLPGQVAEGCSQIAPCAPVLPSPCCMSVALTNAQVRFLRGQAHDLKAMLQVGGKGVTDALAAEVDLALEHHELIKVKVAADDREVRDGMIAELAGKVAPRWSSASATFRGALPALEGTSARIVLPRA